MAQLEAYPCTAFSSYDGDVRPSTPEEKVARILLLFPQDASMELLIKNTQLSRSQILTEIEKLRSLYGVQGDEQSGYTLEHDAEKRLALSRHVGALMEARVPVE